MAFLFSDLQQEVKRRGTVNQSGTAFDTAIKNMINLSLFRVSREAPWRVLRRKAVFNTVGTYTTGSGAGTFTNGSKSITVVGATFLTDGIIIGRRIRLQGSSKVYKIATVTGETTLTIDENYSGTTITGTGTYSILGQEEYNLPIESGHRMFIWHSAYGDPLQLTYFPDQDFYGAGVDDAAENIPTCYRMWGEDMVNTQLKAASVITVSSSSTADTNISITIFGVVSGYPDYEVIMTNSSDGTTAAAGTKSFTSVERVIKSADTTGRITVTANTANTTVAVLPVGDTTAGIMLKKIQLWPLPNTVIPMNVQYYKDPYRLVNDNDAHELGQEFDEAIMLLATSKLKYEQNQDEGEKFFSLYSEEIKNLRKTNMDKIDWFPTLRRPNTNYRGSVHPFLGYAQVGPYYGPSR